MIAAQSARALMSFTYDMLFYRLILFSDTGELAIR
jgi:hypothetical protein